MESSGNTESLEIIESSMKRRLLITLALLLPALALLATLGWTTPL
jgi:hypothetical protein